MLILVLMGGIMDLILQIILIALALVFICFILMITQKKKLSYRYTLIWLFFSFVILVIAIFPQIIMAISNWVHIETPVNALFLISIGAIILIIFFMTIGYSKHSEKITKLVQTNSLLEKRIRELESEKGNQGEI